jgi:hypothetical protein
MLIKETTMIKKIILIEHCRECSFIHHGPGYSICNHPQIIKDIPKIDMLAPRGCFPTWCPLKDYIS